MTRKKLSPVRSNAFAALALYMPRVNGDDVSLHAINPRKVVRLPGFDFRHVDLVRVLAGIEREGPGLRLAHEDTEGHFRGRPDDDAVLHRGPSPDPRASLRRVRRSPGSGCTSRRGLAALDIFGARVCRGLMCRTALAPTPNRGARAAGTATKVERTVFSLMIANRARYHFGNTFVFRRSAALLRLFAHHGELS